MAVTLGIVVMALGLIIVLLAVAAQAGEKPQKPVARYTQNGWVGRSKNWRG